MLWIFWICTVSVQLCDFLNLCPSDPFLSTTANISDEFVTQITPSGWTFIIWSIIYIFLASVLVYVLSGIFRK